MIIYAIDKDGDRREITDLFWFEENGVHDFGGKASYDHYLYEFVIEDDDVIVPPEGE